MRASRLYEFEVITSPEWSNGMTKSLDCPIHAFILVDMNNHREKVLVRFSRLQIEAWVSSFQGCKGCLGVVVELFWNIANMHLGISFVTLYPLGARRLYFVAYFYHYCPQTWWQHHAFRLTRRLNLRCSTMWAA